jgi:hypothetical protein
MFIGHMALGLVQKCSSFTYELSLNSGGKILIENKNVFIACETIIIHGRGPCTAENKCPVYK